jgi:hypothetical protein
VLWLLNRPLVDCCYCLLQNNQQPTIAYIGQSGASWHNIGRAVQELFHDTPQATSGEVSTTLMLPPHGLREPFNIRRVCLATSTLQVHPNADDMRLLLFKHAHLPCI